MRPAFFFTHHNEKKRGLSRNIWEYKDNSMVEGKLFDIFLGKEYSQPLSAIIENRIEDFDDQTNGGGNRLSYAGPVPAGLPNLYLAGTG
jgi:hypothetical protein